VSRHASSSAGRAAALVENESTRANLLLSKELGSWSFIGGIALDLEAQADAPCGGDCGSCDLCQRACPTGALRDGRLDASLCLSYWTTQSKQEIPPGLAAKNPGWAYGCDACQEACPYNSPK
jgi:epoxyqueuosine reductase